MRYGIGLIFFLVSGLYAKTLVIDGVNKSDIKTEFIDVIAKKEEVEVITPDDRMEKDPCHYQNVILLGSKAVKSVTGFGCVETKFLYTYVLFPSLLNISDKSVLRGVAPLPSLNKLFSKELKERKNVVFFSRYSEYIARYLKSQIQAKGADVELVEVEKRHQVPPRLIEKAKEKVNLILIPDPLIATAENIRIIQSLTQKTDMRVISFFTIPNFDATFIDLDNREYANRVLELLKQDLTKNIYFIE